MQQYYAEVHLQAKTRDKATQRSTCRGCKANWCSTCPRHSQAVALVLQAKTRDTATQRSTCRECKASWCSTCPRHSQEVALVLQAKTRDKATQRSTCRGCKANWCSTCPKHSQEVALMQRYHAAVLQAKIETRPSGAHYLPRGKASRSSTYHGQ